MGTKNNKKGVNRTISAIKLKLLTMISVPYISSSCFAAFCVPSGLPSSIIIISKSYPLKQQQNAKWKDLQRTALEQGIQQTQVLQQEETFLTTRRKLLQSTIRSREGFLVHCKLATK